MLGGFHAEAGARMVADSDWRLKKARAVVKLLALAPLHRLARDEIMDRLWPELEPAAALNNLYYAMHIARAALDGDAPSRSGCASSLQLADGVVALAPSGAVCIDSEAFQKAATAAWESHDPLTYSRALDLYTGELLPEDRYEDWAARPREVLRELQLRLLMELAQIHEQRGAYQEAIASLSQLVTEEPTHEEAHVSLMRLHALAGQRLRALRVFARLQATLREELDVEPSANTNQVYADILAGRAAVTTETANMTSHLPTPMTRYIGSQRDARPGHCNAPRVAWSR
jgi:DNA-binding SARP family transcriptional activator